MSGWKSIEIESIGISDFKGEIKMNGWQKLGMAIMALALVSASTAAYFEKSTTVQLGVVIFGWLVTVITDDKLGWMEED